jgi:hypothetical protein
MFPYSSLLVAVRDLGENPSFHSKPQMFRKKLGKDRAGLTMADRRTGGTLVRISSHAQCVHLSSIQLRRRGLTGHTALESAEGVQGVIQRLIFFNGIGTTGEEFSSSRHDCFFGVGNARGKFLVIGLEQRSLIQFAPRGKTGVGSGRA